MQLTHFLPEAFTNGRVLANPDWLPSFILWKSTSLGDRKSHLSLPIDNLCILYSSHSLKERGVG
jgi:hypothetical protein